MGRNDGTTFNYGYVDGRVNFRHLRYVVRRMCTYRSMMVLIMVTEFVRVHRGKKLIKSWRTMKSFSFLSFYFLSFFFSSYFYTNGNNPSRYWSFNRKKCGLANVKLDLKETCTVEDRDPFYDLIRFTPRNENLSVHTLVRKLDHDKLYECDFTCYPFNEVCSSIELE